MIHPTAIVSEGARLDENVEVGAYSLIGDGVEIGAGSVIGSHVVLKGPTRIGRNNQIFQFCSIGEVPQDKKFHGEESILEIGDHNTIREYCSINRGTEDGGGATRIGSHNWIMAYVHIAHDCQLGDHNTLANGASLAGHVELADQVILGGFTLVHQFCAIGAGVFSRMGSAIVQDVPPYVMVAGNVAEARGINIEGLKRRGLDGDALQAVRRAYKIIYRSGLKLDEAVEQLQPLAAESEQVATMAEFLRSTSRGIVR
ncbi:MAG TPA: acyl-[acyl-carrier-protein]--UDP-N-acetylglucosamine O-acyltransferase [Gammaproteobacteria bacterium]|nr:acyl-[acyl-carrier-protein]--UDP-N-acetylglucosamine O-acyltransferase [Gammaproteobacteria bacterium]